MLGYFSFRSKVTRQNFSEMIRRLGIEPCNDIVFNCGRTFNPAVRACRACRRAEDCSAWLNANTEALDAAPAFCPNRVKFQMMRRVHS